MSGQVGSGLKVHEVVQDVQERCMDLFGMEQTMEITSVIEPEILGVVPEVILSVPAQTIQIPRGNALSANVDLKTKESMAVKKEIPSFIYSFLFAFAALTLVIAILFSRFYTQKE